MDISSPISSSLLALAGVITQSQHLHSTALYRRWDINQIGILNRIYIAILGVTAS